MVRAKFRVESRTETTNGHNVVLHPVTGPSEENKQFWKWTPAGKLELYTINPDAAAQLKPGAEFYLDFVAADGGAQ